MGSALTLQLKMVVIPSMGPLQTDTLILKIEKPYVQQSKIQLKQRKQHSFVYNIMLSLTQVNSKKSVDPQKVKEVGYDFMIFLRQSLVGQ